MIFSGSTLLKMQALGHILLGGLFMTNPKQVTDLNPIFIFGMAMNLTLTPTFDTLSPPVITIGLFFLLWGISDLFAISAFTSRQESLGYWSVLSKVRLAFFFIVATVSCFFRPEAFEPGSTVAAIVDNLANQIVFSWTFAELAFWAWTFLTVREEKKSYEAALEKRML